ncbi:MAG: archease [Candidatus Methylarchaceae archaeon HK01B]|nr:archease [Candidatus Methylarchaceae archaeon HK01M]MCP8312178.1 archease [Candidatus Methylarchaceae archaeon HK02M1]MCP8318856.1 archease [Candidatus Methylarchaceae archaeon HK01B]
MSIKKSYIFLEHTGDEFIEAYGSTLEEAFESAGTALVDTMIDIDEVDETIEEFIKVDGWDLKNLLYNWLEELLIRVTSEDKVYSSFKVKIDEKEGGYELEAVVKGEKLNLSKHKPKTEVKAVTYHQMDIKQDSEWVALRFLLDL